MFIGTNTIVGNKPDKLFAAAENILRVTRSKGGALEKWDGKAADRIVAHLLTNT